MKKKDEALMVAFSKIKEELDVHLDSINNNTNEINANFEHIAGLEQKVDKLNERFDEIQYLISSLAGANNSKYKKEDFQKVELSVRELEVFLVLYTEKEPLSCFEVAKRIGLTPDLVSKYVKVLIAKGVPVNTSYEGSNAFIFLDDEFRNLQAKENVLNISENISSSII